jgi:hypothetical protein
MDEPNANQPFSRETVEKGKQTAGLVKETAKSAATDVKTWAGDQADRAREAFRSTATRGVDRGRVQAAGALDRAADSLRDAGPHIPGGQKTTDLANRAAEGLHNTAGYLRRKDARAIALDVKDTVRRHPTQALLGALVAGFLVGRTIKRK